MKLKFATTLILILMLISCGTKVKLMSSTDLERLNYQEVKGFYDVNNTDAVKPDKFPMYPEGLNGLMNDVNNIIRYPENAVENGIEGKVILKYSIEKDGSVSDIQIEKSVSKDLDEEAIRVIKNLKRFYPGFLNEKAVKVEFRQPFDFKLT